MNASKIVFAFPMDRRLLALILLSIIPTEASRAQNSASLVPANNPVFGAMFAQTSFPNQWTIDKGNRPWGSLIWSNDAVAPGLHFEAPGRFSAWTHWACGTEPFDFWFDTEITSGTSAGWRYNGIAVSLCSALPSDMTRDDVAYSIGLYWAGLQCSIKQGPFLKPGGNSRITPNFPRAETTNRYELNLGGAGGENFSVQWPSSTLDGQKIRCHIQRLDGNRIRFELYHSWGVWSKPWWGAEVEIPQKLTDVPIRYVSVLGTEEDPDSTIPPPPTKILKGRIFDLRGWTSATSPPEITGYVSGDQGVVAGSSFTVIGTNFSPHTRVVINGTACQTKWVSGTELTARAGQLNLNGINRLQVVNDDGLFAGYDPGLATGLTLDRVEPCEASLDGGDMVTLRGGGFSTATQVAINGRPAEVVGTPESNAMQVRVPPGIPGLAALSASNGGHGFACHASFGYAPHPFLLFKGKEDLKAQRAKFISPGFSDYRKAILAATDESITNLDDSDFLKKAIFEAPLAGSAFAYQMTGDTQYKDAFLRACDLYLNGSDYKFKASDAAGTLFQQLGQDDFMVMNGQAVALAYDMMFDELTPQLRLRMEQRINRFLAIYPGLIANQDWWYDNIANPSNTVAVGNGGMGIMALALRYSTPKADAMVDQAANVIKNQYKAMLPDGGCVEGNLYWNYGLGHLIAFGLALENAIGNDKGLLDDPALRNMDHFASTQIGGDGNMFVFNDTQPWLSGVIPCAFAATRFDQPLMRWLADEMMRRGADPQGISNFNASEADIAFLLRDSKPHIDKIPDLPTVDYMKILNWGVLRSKPDAVGAGLVMGIKGVGGEQTHHSEEDAGSFVLQSRGESFIIHPGYYQDAASEHNLPLIGSIRQAVNQKPISLTANQAVTSAEGQLKVRSFIAPISDAWETGDLRTMTVDSTAAYPKELAIHVRRVMVLDSDKAAIVLDQVEPVNSQDTITSFYQCGFPSELLPEGKGFRINGAKSDLAALIDGPTGTWSLRPCVWQNKWIFTKLGVQWFQVIGAYGFVPGQPRLTIMLPLNKGASIPTVTVLRTLGTISISIPKASPVKFHQEAGLWKLTKT